MVSNKEINNPQERREEVNNSKGDGIGGEVDTIESPQSSDASPKKSSPSEENIEEEPAEQNPGDPSPSYVIVGLQAEDVNALKNCISQFSSFPFPNRIESFRNINPFDSKGDGVIVEDLKVSEEPRLVMVKNYNALQTDLHYDLLGENTFYCVKPIVSTSVTNVQFSLHCGSEMVFAEVENEDELDLRNVSQIEIKDQNYQECK